MKFKSIAVKLLTIFATLGFVLTICITAFVIPASSQGFYKRQFEKNNTLEKVISQERQVPIKARDFIRELDDNKLLKLMNGVLDYCVGRSNTPNPLNDNGEIIEIFNKNELSHFNDVRKLFIGVFIAGGVGFLFFIAGLLVSLINKRFYFNHAKRYPLYTLTGVGVVLLIIGLGALINFRKVFYLLHLIFFEGNFAFSKGVMINLIGDIFAPMALISIPIIIIFIALFITLVIYYNRRLNKVFTKKTDKINA